MYFISSPYSHEIPAVVELRMQQLNMTIAQLTERGVLCVSPLWNHYVLPYSKTMGSDWNFWKVYCENLISRCDGIIVLDNIEGWNQSRGVAAEIEFAIKNGINVLYYSEFIKR